MAVWDLNSNLDVFGMQTFLRGLVFRKVLITYLEVSDRPADNSRKTER
jgi:hypothetical protein